MPLGFCAKLDEESPSHTTYLGSVNLIDRLKEAIFEVSLVARGTQRNDSLVDQPHGQVSRSPWRLPDRLKEAKVIQYKRMFSRLADELCIALTRRAIEL